MPKSFEILITILIITVLGMAYPEILIWIATLSGFGILYLTWIYIYRSDSFKPQSKTYKTLEKMKKRREKTDQNKHVHINDQITYIHTYWGYTKEQEKIIEKFVKKRAYSEIYNKLTASLFPQIITLIDNCNAREKKGCKREVSKRIRVLTDIMKDELKKKKSESSNNFETTMEVYDHLVKEIKP